MTGEKPRRAAELRRRAEEHLRQKGGADRPREGDPERLLHELEVHQVELEVQNEELRAARVQAETNLVRYTRLFDFAPIGYAALDTDETIRDINHAGAAILGVERSRLTGIQFGFFVAVGDRPAFRALLEEEARGAGDEAVAELNLMRGEKGILPVRLTVAALGGDDPQFLLAFEDVGERKLREAEVARAQNELQGANRRKDDFLAALSHELRNPLAPIRNGLFILGRSALAGEQAKSALAVIDRQVGHLTRLVDDLLDVTRITRGKVELHRSPLELSDLVGRTLVDCQAGFDRVGVRLERQLEPGPLWIEADPTRLVQVLTNVLGNAEKFTPRGGRVTVELARSGPSAVLRVRDTGAGIAPNLLPHVFEPFSQAPQTKDRSRGGLGLGLAMVKGIVTLHGGTVHVDSGGSGQGTEVVITLPLSVEPALPAGRTAPTTSVVARRVLVIEDNHDAADSLRSALAISGHDVRVAYDGRRGIELAREFRPEVVICDIGLPEMDGYEVARAFRSEPILREACLVALSGYARTEDLDAARQAGFDRHVPKPASPEALERVMAALPVRT